MLAQFSIYPMQAAHMSKDLARVISILEETGLEYRLEPMGTCIEGKLEEVLTAIQRCHQALACNHDRVVTSIVLDDSKAHPHHLTEMVASVEHLLGHPAHSSSRVLTDWD